MLKCDQVQMLLSEYIDHELPLWEMQMIKFHIRLCPDCSREFDSLRNTDHLLKLREDDMVTSDHFTDDILTKISVIAKNKRDNVPFFQRFIEKISTYGVWIRYAFNPKNRLGWAWKASFTLLFMVTLIGLFSLSPFYCPSTWKNQQAGLVKKKLGQKTKIVNFIEVEFVDSDTKDHGQKKNLPSFNIFPS